MKRFGRPAEAASVEERPDARVRVLPRQRPELGPRGPERGVGLPRPRELEQAAHDLRRASLS